MTVGGTLRIGAKTHPWMELPNLPRHSSGGRSLNHGEGNQRDLSTVRRFRLALLGASLGACYVETVGGSPKVKRDDVQD